MHEHFSPAPLQCIISYRFGCGIPPPESFSGDCPHVGGWLHTLHAIHFTGVAGFPSPLCPQPARQCVGPVGEGHIDQKEGQWLGHSAGQPSLFCLSHQ